MNDNIIDLVLGFTCYLRNNKFNISVDAEISFFQILPQINIFNYDDFYNISKALFCNNIFTFSIFDRLFNEYMHHKDKVIVQKLIDKEKQRLRENAKIELDKTAERINKRIENKRILQSNFDEIIDKKIPIPKKSISDEVEEFVKEDYQAVLDFDKLKSSEIAQQIENTSKFVVKYKSRLKRLLVSNLSEKNYNEVNDLVFNQLKRLQQIEKMLNEKKELDENTIEIKAKRSLETKRKSLRKEQDKQLEELKVKYGVIEHREEFKGKGAVIDLLKQQDKIISDLTDTEYTSLLYYINLNASKFRTKVSLSMKQSKYKVIDMKKTVNQSFKYGGIPIKLYYKKPIIKKYKLFCLFDISGSVSKYLSILTPFLMELNTVFNGGIEVYCFVNSIINFTNDFKENTVNELINSISNYRGYSDYYTALEQFYNETIGRMDRNSLILYFGDARNNKNETGTYFLEKIKSKVAYTVWLNPEPKDKWDTADSIISQYSKCVNNTYEISTVRHLIKFLNNFSIR